MSRRTAREAALQVLFQTEMTGATAEEAFEYVFSEFKVNEKAQEYCRELVIGTVENQLFIDETIKKLSNEWDLKRMAAVDRNVIRLGLYEILFREDVPNNVAINEAIELGKEYSTVDSGKFINGILGNAIKNIDQFVQEKPKV